MFSKLNPIELHHATLRYIEYLYIWNYLKITSSGPQKPPLGKWCHTLLVACTMSITHHVTSSQGAVSGGLLQSECVWTLYVDVYVWLCVCMCLCECLYACMWLWMCVRVCACVNMCARVCMRENVWMYVCGCVWTCVCVWMCVCMCVHMCACEYAESVCAWIWAGDIGGCC